MAFPNDLSDVAAIKIHPAIGCARLSDNNDYYEFFDFEAKREAGQPREYMSLQNGKHWIKRQAVKFRLFAYKADGTELGELTHAILHARGIVVTWRASVANRKLHVWSNTTPVVAAEASATGTEVGRLEGPNPWRQSKVWLGEITGDGTFIPPKSGVYRKTKDTVIPPYGSHQSDNGVLDTTSDGAIHATLTGAGAIPVIPACVIVAPQDHSPDVDPGQIDNHQNKDFVQATRALLGIPPNAVLNGKGYAMDFAMMRTINAQYQPGMEICLGQNNPALPNPASAFFPRGQDHIDANEIRPSYAAGRASAGALTGGLCSAWQTDLTACLNWWTSTYPNQVEFEAAPTSRTLARQAFLAAGPQINNPEWLNAYIGMMEVARNLDDDVNFLFGTERDPNDNTGAAPVAPFPLDP